MALDNALMIADVMHARQQPRRHRFRYSVYYLCFALGDRLLLPSSLLSLDRWNIFSFHERDHGARDGSVAENWIGKILADWNIVEADGDIVLMTLPRVLGYVFNPVSFWFCLDKQGEVRAVLSEVSNTFGEHHNYICFHDDHRPILPHDQIRAEKVFHVSPFMDVEGHYLFRFAYGARKIGVWIDHVTSQGMMIATSVIGQRRILTDGNLLKCFFRYPLVTLKVIGLIHAEALRLVLKGMRYRPKPLPPVTEVSR